MQDIPSWEKGVKLWQLYARESTCGAGLIGQKRGEQEMLWESWQHISTGWVTQGFYYIQEYNNTFMESVDFIFSETTSKKKSLNVTVEHLYRNFCLKTKWYFNW